MGQLVAADSKLMALLRHIARGVSVTKAAEMVGIGRATASRWLSDPANKELLKRLIQERVPDVELTPAHILVKLSQLAEAAQSDGDFKTASETWKWLHFEVTKLQTMPNRGVINAQGVELHKALGGADEAAEDEPGSAVVGEEQAPEDHGPSEMEGVAEGDDGVHVDAGEVPSDDVSDVLRGEAAQ